MVVCTPLSTLSFPPCRHSWSPLTRLKSRGQRPWAPSLEPQLLTAQPALSAPISTLLLLPDIRKPQNSYACHFSFILQNKTKFLHLAFKALPKLATSYNLSVHLFHLWAPQLIISQTPTQIPHFPALIYNNLSSWIVLCPSEWRGENDTLRISKRAFLFKEFLPWFTQIKLSFIIEKNLITNFH